MARITCRTPSTGRPTRVSLVDVGASLTTIIEAPDFSVPDTSNKFSTRDPADASRAIRPGEIFFLTPLAATNKDTVTRWIEVVLVTESGASIVFAKMKVPAGDTAYIPMQGRSLFKRDSTGTYGDRIQVRAEVANAFDVWSSAEEKLSNEHTGVV